MIWKRLWWWIIKRPVAGETIAAGDLVYCKGRNTILRFEDGEALKPIGVAKESVDKGGPIRYGPGVGKVGKGDYWDEVVANGGKFYMILGDGMKDVRFWLKRNQLLLGGKDSHEYDAAAYLLYEHEEVKDESQDDD